MRTKLLAIVTVAALGALTLAPTLPVQAGPPVVKTQLAVPTAGLFVTVSNVPGSGALVTQVTAPNFGRVGNIIFETGDVIYSIGGVNVGPGVNLDTLFAQAMASGNRYVTVRDRNSGQILTLSF